MCLICGSNKTASSSLHNSGVDSICNFPQFHSEYFKPSAGVRLKDGTTGLSSVALPLPEGVALEVHVLVVVFFAVYTNNSELCLVFENLRGV